MFEIIHNWPMFWLGCLLLSAPLVAIALQQVNPHGRGVWFWAMAFIGATAITVVVVAAVAFGILLVGRA